MEEEDYEQAAMYFSLSYEEAPIDDASSPFLLGLSLQKLNKLKASEKYLKESFERQPNHIAAHCEWARVITRLGKGKEALSKISKLEKIYKDNALILLTKSEVYLILKDFKHAYEYLYKARKAGANNIEYKEVLAKIFNSQALLVIKEGNFEDGKRLLVKAIELLPSWSSPYVNLGHIYHIKGKIKESERLYKKALELEDDNPTALYNLSLLYVEQLNIRAALKMIQILLDKYNDYPGLQDLIQRVVELNDEPRKNR